MFKKLKLKNTFLCTLSLFLPSLIIAVIGLVAAFFADNEETASLIFVISLVVAATPILTRMGKIFTITTTLSLLNQWQKDRTSFETEINGTDYTDVEAAIVKRASAFGKPISEYVGAVLSHYTQKHTIGGLYQYAKQTLVIYSSPTLTYDTYKATLDQAKAKVELQIKNKNKECACAVVIFITGQAEQSVIQQIREDALDELDFVVVPLLYEGVSRQYYFDGMCYNSIFGKSCKSYAFDIIRKFVFGGKIPLENNNRYDYENEISQWQDKTMGDLLLDIKQSDEEEKHFLENTFNQLADKEYLYREDVLYIKLNNNLFSYGAFFEDEKPDTVYLWGGDTWDFPSETTVSKKDKAILDEIATAYFAEQNKYVKFDLEENEE